MHFVFICLDKHEVIRPFNTSFHLRRAGKTNEAFQERAKFVRIGRPGEPHELVSMAKALLLDNSFITGEIIKIDGGDF